MVVCIVGDKKSIVGVLLAGIKKWYSSLDELGDERIVIVDPDIAERNARVLEKLMESRVVVKLPRTGGTVPDRAGKL